MKEKVQPVMAVAEKLDERLGCLAAAQGTVVQHRGIKTPRQRVEEHLSADCQVGCVQFARQSDRRHRHQGRSTRRAQLAVGQVAGQHDNHLLKGGNCRAHLFRASASSRARYPAPPTASI
jgi:hypothetical protein